MPFRDAMFFMPALEGVEVPTWFQDAWGTLGTSLDGAFRNVGEWASDPSQQAAIEIPGAGALTLQEISAYLPISGTLWQFSGSWAAAATIPGWAICDGSNGTPKIHPAIDDASPIQRMVRATAYGASSGGTAGTECHRHTTCTLSSCAGGHNHALTSDCVCTTCDCHCHTLGTDCACTTCDCHCHGVQGYTCCDSHCHTLDALCACTCTDGCHCHASGGLYAAQCDRGGQTCSNGTDHCFSCNDHCHNVCGNTQYNTHAHCVQGATCCGDHCHILNTACSDTTCDCHCHGVQGATCCNDHHHCLCGTTCNVSNHAHGLSCKITSCDTHLSQVIDVIWLMKL